MFVQNTELQNRYFNIFVVVVYIHIQCVCLIIRLTPFPNSDLFFPKVESQSASLPQPLDKFYQHAFSSFALAATCQNKKEEEEKIKIKIGQG